MQASLTTLDALLDALQPGDEVFVAGCNGEPAALIDALQRRPDAARGVCFSGIHIPGVNRFSYAELTPSTRQRGIFLSPELQSAYRQGRYAHLPLTYTGAWRWLSAQRFDYVIFQGKPHAHAVNLSLAADFTPAVLANAKHVIALCDDALPCTSALDVQHQSLHRIDCQATLIDYDAGNLSPAFSALARVIAAHIPDGTTLQLGLGKLQKALLLELTQHRNLAIHSGMISDPVLALARAGALRGQDAITAGVALGSSALYQALQEELAVDFRAVCDTHALQTLAAVPNFVAVNAIIEVDLSGQVNAESIDGRQVSGGGGMADFVRGAQINPAGRSILATTARSGERARIVAALAPGSAVTVPRDAVDCIATEYGCVQLAGLDVQARAQALIGVAHPDDREALARAWQQNAGRPH
jgi:acyl-CoA hydrolase